MKVIFILPLCLLAFFGHLQAAQFAEIKGAVAYTDVIQFDYTQDGILDQVQFWLSFEGSPALGAPGEPTYQPETGAVYYYLVDVKRKKKVDNWLMGFSMMEGPPPSGPYPMTDIKIAGTEASFNAFDMAWNVVDGGDDYTKDSVKIHDGFRGRGMPMYGGDVTVVSVAADDKRIGGNCVECHRDAVTTMLTLGGTHSALKCTECHVGHPPEVKKPFKSCLSCHQPHSERMNEENCSQCHRAHTASEVSYAYNVPSQYCGACHQDVADVLAANPSAHSRMACALCHQSRHGATSDCLHCHGAPHPKHVMQKPGICSECHNTAHALKGPNQN